MPLVTCMRNALLFSTLMSSDNGVKEVNVSIMTSGTCLQAVETRKSRNE
jgi:hypothetical protein